MWRTCSEAPQPRHMLGVAFPLLRIYVSCASMGQAGWAHIRAEAVSQRGGFSKTRDAATPPSELGPFQVRDGFIELGLTVSAEFNRFD